MQPAAATKPSWWLWPTILSLDAPAVVILWQALMARGASVELAAPERFVVGCSVWLAYAADRWIEVWRLNPERIQTHRHRFYLQWRWEIFAAWVGLLGVDLAVAYRGLSSSEFRAGALLLVPVAAYLFSHQLLHRSSRWRAPKEVCVAVLLGAGAGVFVAEGDGVGVALLAVPLSLFVLLCFSNCALISVWEDEVDASHGQTSLALQWKRAAEISRVIPWLVAVVSAAAWLTAGAATGAAAACSASSGILMGLVDMSEARIGRVWARVLADVALMTPIVPLFFLGGLR